MRDSMNVRTRLFPRFSRARSLLPAARPCDSACRRPLSLRLVRCLTLPAGLAILFLQRSGYAQAPYCTPFAIGHPPACLRWFLARLAAPLISNPAACQQAQSDLPAHRLSINLVTHCSLFICLKNRRKRRKRKKNLSFLNS